MKPKTTIESGLLGEKTVCRRAHDAESGEENEDGAKEDQGESEVLRLLAASRRQNREFHASVSSGSTFSGWVAPPWGGACDTLCMDDPLFIYVDVDDTLCRSELAKPRRTFRRSHLRSPSTRRAAIIVGAAGGPKPSPREFAQKLGIEGCFTGFLHKPQIFIDDTSGPTNGPTVVHGKSKETRTMQEYRKASKSKKERED